MKKPAKQTDKNRYGIVTTDGKPFEVPVKGSIGLLTLGYRGLMAWREKRIEAEREKKRKEPD